MLLKFQLFDKTRKIINRYVDLVLSGDFILSADKQKNTKVKH